MHTVHTEQLYAGHVENYDSKDIPSSSVMVTIVDEDVGDRTGPVGVTLERVTVNS